MKTDLFEEAAGIGLTPFLSSVAATVVAIDVAWPTVQAAAKRGSPTHTVVADVRALPFPKESFQQIVSISTLDHFSSQEEISVSLKEMWRVLPTGGSLILTLDNPWNPWVALRNVLPFWLLNRLRIVPYYVGATCGPGRLGRMLREAGFQVLERGALMHIPRVIAVAVSRFIPNRGGAKLRTAFLNALNFCERLEALPTRFLTGNFVAVRAVRL